MVAVRELLAPPTSGLLGRPCGAVICCLEQPGVKMQGCVFAACASCRPSLSHRPRRLLGYMGTKACRHTEQQPEATVESTTGLLDLPACLCILMWRVSLQRCAVAALAESADSVSPAWC